MAKIKVSKVSKAPNVVIEPETEPVVEILPEPAAVVESPLDLNTERAKLHKLIESIPVVQSEFVAEYGKLHTGLLFIETNAVRIFDDSQSAQKVSDAAFYLKQILDSVKNWNFHSVQGKIDAGLG